MPNLIQHTPNIWTIEGFLDKTECQNLITYSENIGYQEAEVSLATGATMLKSVRNNDRLLYKNEELAQNYWEVLKDFCPKFLENNIAIGLNELFRFYKYTANQRFKRHIDGRFTRPQTTPKEESRITFMIYLNDEFEGGATIFDELTIKPKTGNALCFIHEQRHEGSTVTAGTKYVLRSDVMYCEN